MSGTETERERRRRLLSELLEDIRATRSGFKAADNVSREALYDRDAVSLPAKEVEKQRRA